MSRQLRQARDDKIVNGYVRNNSDKYNDMTVPEDIVNLCLGFYHISIDERFEHYNAKKYRLYNDNMCVTGCPDTGFIGVCYGAECISSSIPSVYEWTFKLSKDHLIWP